MKKVEKSYSHWSGPEFTSKTLYPMHSQYDYLEPEFWDPYFRTRTKIDHDTINEKKIILFTGDSFTFGDGVNYKDTFCNVVDTQYTSDEYVCINIAFRGNPNSRIMLSLAQWLNRYGSQVETVICGFSFLGRRTIIDDDNGNLYKDHVYDDEITSQWTSLRNFNPTFDNAQISKQKFNACVTLSNDAQDIFEFERDILLLKGLSKIHNFKVGWWSWVRNGFSPEVLEVITQNIDDDDFKHIDFNVFHLPRLPDDGHFNVQGHKILADIIGYFLKNEL